MPEFVIKASPDEDLYVLWSSVVDSPTDWGTAEELGLPKDRKERADKTGTSLQTADLYDWDHSNFIVRELGDGDFYDLPRVNLSQFLKDLGDNPTKEQQQIALDNNCTRIALDEPTEAELNDIEVDDDNL